MKMDSAYHTGETPLWKYFDNFSFGSQT